MSLAVLLFIAIAFGAVVLMRLSRMGTLLAFLLTGVVIGPHILNLFELTHVWSNLGELGIIFLWFTIGLQINMSRLWQLRKTTFGLGAAQVMMVAVMLFPILFGVTTWTMTGTVMIALMLAMSSTSEDMQILLDRNQMQTTTGRQAFSILLFQDLLSIPLLALLPVVAGVSFNLGAAAIDVLVTSAILILGVIITSKFIITPLMRLVSKLRSNEAFVLSVVVCVIGCCFGFHLMDLTPALGAFLAGMLMSESVFHHQIQSSIEPYSTMFLALFFVVLGMGLNLPFLLDHIGTISLFVIGLVIIKFAALYMVARVRHVNSRDATLLSLILAQGGEFGLLILQTMKTNEISAVPLEHQELLMAVIIVSMMITPILLLIYDMLAKSGKIFVSKPCDSANVEEVKDHTPEVIICGFGRMGQIIAQMLEMQHIPYVAIDHNVDEVMLAREQGYNVVYGNSSDIKILTTVGLKPRKTRAVVVAVDDPAVSYKIVQSVQTITPKMKIFARAHRLSVASELHKLGVTFATPEIIESSFLLGEHLLGSLGVHQPKINHLLQTLRVNNYENIKRPVDGK